MSLSPGTHLGPYEVISLLGAGGMGEVYRARDTRLDRIVAIKVLPAHVSSRPELRQRFEREARAISSLSHPHICALHDIGSQEGTDFLVMEYLEGETLARRLSRGALAPDQLLRYAIQVADGLEQAHRHGIVHRDLKPANIMLTKTGAKLLDFGLAKLRHSEMPKPVSVLTELPTKSDHLTVEGAIVGTFQYMAPEQLEGKEVDARTDIFAFGVILYEMATGRRPFGGQSQASIIAAILSLEPLPISSVPRTGSQAGLPGPPPALDQLVKTCLAKDPDERWQTIHDVKKQLEWISAAGSQPEAPAVLGPRLRWRRLRERVAWALAALALAAAATLVWFNPRGSTAPARPVRFAVLPPEKTSLAGSIAVSPDGSQVAFAALTPDGNTSLWVRSWDSLNARQVPGTEGALHPFWSPDGRFLAFFADHKLKKIRLEGGPPQVLCDVFDARGGTWNRSGIIVFARNFGDRLYRVSESGGAYAPVTTINPARQESSHQWPHFLPDGNRFLYLVWSAQPDARGIYAGSLDGKESKRILGVDWMVDYAPGPGGRGQLFFLRGRTLMAQAFDPETLALSGEPTPIAEQVWYDGITPGLSAFSLSDTGVLAYRTGSIRNTQLAWFDRSGRLLEPVTPPGSHWDHWLSPDGRRIAFSRIDAQTGTHDVWVYEISRATTTRFTFDPGNDGFPVWSPDGSRIVFSSDRDNQPPNLYEKAASGAGAEQPLHRGTSSMYATDWSRDGRYIVYAYWDPKTAWDLWVLPTFGERKPVPYLLAPFDAFQAKFSPDGRWIAYTSNESGRDEVYVQPFPMAGGKWPISTSGGAQPRWRQDGRELYYLAPDRKLMAVEVKVSGNSFEAGVPRPLFQAQVTGLVDARNHYFVSPDGLRFLINTVVQDSAASPIAVTLNWTADLKR